MRRLQWRRNALGAGLAALLAQGVGHAPLAAAEDPKPAAGGVALDQLLQIPDSVEVEVATPRKAGTTRGQWQARFREAQQALDDAEKNLAATQAEIKELAQGTSNYSLGAPGLPVNTDADSEASPMSYRLTQEVKRRREDVERARRRLQELTVEANLAGVPEDWQRPDVAAPPE